MYRGGGMGSVVAGLIAIAIGIGVIVVSYQLAQPGGIYFVPIGLIASGFLAIFRGLAMQAPRAGSAAAMRGQPGQL
jgi:hypothetical protein